MARDVRASDCDRNRVAARARGAGVRSGTALGDRGLRWLRPAAVPEWRHDDAAAAGAVTDDLEPDLPDPPGAVLALRRRRKASERRQHRLRRVGPHRAARPDSWP